MSQVHQWDSVELECCILPVATQFLCTLLALPGLLRLRCGGQGVAVGPQDADGGGGEVCEGLLALLLPPTALLPRVTPALLISVPAELEYDSSGNQDNDYGDGDGDVQLGVHTFPPGPEQEGPQGGRGLAQVEPRVVQERVGVGLRRRHPVRRDEGVSQRREARVG